MISKFWCRSIHAPAMSFWNSALVEAAWRLDVDVLDDGVLPQLCEAQAVHQPLVVALGRLPVDQQSEPLLEAECRNVGLSLLFGRRWRRGNDMGRPLATCAGPLVR